MPALIPLYSCALVRDASVKADANRPVERPREAAAIVRAVIGNTDREHFVLLALDIRNRVIGAQVVSVGTLSASLVHPREMFKPAILLNAAGVIVAHNHPSGDPAPSAEDRECTKRLVKAGALLGIPVLDHVILGADAGFFSFREAGQI